VWNALWNAVWNAVSGAVLVRAAVLLCGSASLAGPSAALPVAALGPQTSEAPLAGSAASALDAAARIEALRRTAQQGLDPGEQQAALEQLFRSGTPEADAALLAVFDGSAGEIALRAARAIAQRRPLGGALLERVEQACAANPRRPLSAAVLGEWLPAAGERSAELPAVEAAAALRVLDLLLRLRSSSDPSLVRAARVGLERYFARAAELERIDGAVTWLAGASARGMDPLEAASRRARLVLAHAVDPRPALEAAQALARASVAAQPLRGTLEQLAWSMQAAYLEGIAQIALAQPAAAEAALARAIALGEALVRERADLWPDPREPDERHVDLAIERFELLGVAHLGAILAGLASGAPPDAPNLRAHALAAHEASLSAQIAAATTGRGDGLGGWDDLLDRDLAPRRLCLSNARSRALPPERALLLLEGLLRVLGAVAPTELPGFVGAAADEDPFADPARRARYEALVDARLSGLDNAIGRVRTAEVFDALQALMLRQMRLDLAEWRSRVLEDGGRELLEQRVPSTAALDLASLLRRDGRAEAAAALCQRALDDLARQKWSKAYLWSPWQAARLAAARGAALTDAKQPLEAERVLLEALQRLEELESSLVERRGDASKDGQWARGLEGFVRTVRLTRAAVYVSLAVNANVRLADQAKALAYFEQSWALDPGEDGQIMLACYRARSGEFAAARAALASVLPEPRHYYNLACTYALLGEAERALEFLALELAEGNSSPGARERQQSWALEDPDLSALRADPRFQALVAPTPRAAAR
jgi:hypothetical protein